MKTFRLWLLAAALFSVVLPACAAGKVAPAAKEVNPRPFTIPAVQEWSGGAGSFQLGEQVNIVCGDTRLSMCAELLAADLRLVTGKEVEVVMPHLSSIQPQSLKASKSQQLKTSDILLVYKPSKRLGAEGYVLDITPKGVRIEATERGAMHATQTLLQLISADSPSLPCGRIADRPDYPLRGLVLDCGRKYIPMDYLRRLVRTMAYYKMNTLSVHLNDNGFAAYFHDDWNETYAAFRLQSETFPGLTAEDGSYTKAEFRQFILDAAQLGVEIIPEIDVPAHSLAFAHYRPSLGSKEFGMDHLDLANPEVTPFLDSLFAEYIDGPEPVFAGPRVHIGTDEYSNKRKETVEQFRALTDHLIHQVEAHGKQAVVWGALTHARGETPVKVDNVLMYDWYNGYADPDSMHALGYHLVSIPDGMTYIVPAAGYYYDYLNIPKIYKTWTPANIGGKHFPERDPQIEGGMFAVWNDIVGNGISVADIHHRAFPAIQVIAEKTWAADTVRTCDDWLRLSATLGEAPGINDLGRYPAISAPSEDGSYTILTAATVTPASTRPIPHIGYPYRVSFDIECPAIPSPEASAPEARGTALFRSADAEFYLADPITGRLGFARDGYLFSFRHALRPGVREHIAIEGDHRETRLYIDGRLVETLAPDVRLFPKNKPFKLIRTLRFPLATTDANIRSRITNLCVESL